MMRGSISKHALDITCLFHMCVLVSKREKKGKLEFLILLIFFIGIHPCLVINGPAGASDQMFSIHIAQQMKQHLQHISRATKLPTRTTLPASYFVLGNLFWGPTLSSTGLNPICTSIISTTMPQRKTPALSIRSAPPKEHHRTITCNLNQKPN